MSSMVGIRWLPLLGLLWAVPLILHGRILDGLLVPRIDPRRDEPTTARRVLVWTVAATLAGAVWWLFLLGWTVSEDRYVRIAAATREIVSTQSGYLVAGAVLLVAALEVASVRRALRSHRERELDVMS